MLSLCDTFCYDAGIGGTTLTAIVDLDESVSIAVQPFDFSFDGTASFTLPIVPFRARDLLKKGGVGLLQGPSGSGKTSLMHLLLTIDAEDPAAASAPSLCVAGEAFVAWETLGTVASVVPTELLDVVCLPEHCRNLKYGVLSTGERFMADLARTLMYAAQPSGEESFGPFMPSSESDADANIAFGLDEFTSTIDRKLAKRVCCSLASYLRKTKFERGVLLATCHVDVAGWLRPDWTFDTGDFEFTERKGDGTEKTVKEEVKEEEVTELMSFERPEIELVVHPCTQAAWQIFKDHHYLSGDIHFATRCLVATWEGRPVAFECRLPFPGVGRMDCYREHRLVVLPDFQGLGIGPKFSDFFGCMHLRQGLRFSSRTAHPRLCGYRQHASAKDQWLMIGGGSKKSGIIGKHMGVRDLERAKMIAARTACSHEYVGTKADRKIFYECARKEVAVHNMFLSVLDFYKITFVDVVVCGPLPCGLYECAHPTLCLRSQPHDLRIDSERSHPRYSATGCVRNRRVVKCLPAACT